MLALRWLCCVGLLACGEARGGGDWARVSREDLPLLVEVTGALRAAKSEQLGPPAIASQWDYKISMMAPEGGQVKAGAEVLGFDPMELRRTLEEQQNEASTKAKQIEKRQSDAAMARREEALKLAEAEGRLRKAALKLESPVDLTGAVELAEARLEHALAEQEVAHLRARALRARQLDDALLAELRDRRARAELRVAETQSNLARMTVKAPRAGTVIHVQTRRDEKKKVGDSIWRGDKALEIADLSQMLARGEVDESDASRVSVGQRVTLRLDAHPDSEFFGTVREIQGAVQQRSAAKPSKVVRLEIALERTDPQRMRPGMRFRGAIEIGRVRGALLIPSAAVFSAAGDVESPAAPVAYVRRGGGVAAVPLVLGPRGGDRVEVRAGLREGDQVSRVEPGTSEGEER